MDEVDQYAAIIRAQGELHRTKIQNGVKVILESEAEIPFSEKALTLINLINQYQNGTNRCATTGVLDETFQEVKQHAIDLRKQINALVGE